MDTDKQQKTGNLLRKIIIILVVCGIGWIVLTRLVGDNSAKRLVSAVAHTPITLKDDVENISASSWKGLPLTLTYTGTLNLTVDVVRGNPMDIFLINQSELENFQKHNKFSHFTNFMADKTKVYKRSARLAEGTYYLVLRDNTLGILSASSSDVKVTARLEP